MSACYQSGGVHATERCGCVLPEQCGCGQVLPSTLGEATKLLTAEPVFVRVEGRLTAAECAELSKLITAADLDQLSVTNESLRIVGPLPFQRLPLLGIGVRADGSLIVLVVDGRQQQMPGGTITELARLMQQHGAVTAGLGCAGGDVALVQKQQGEVRVLNSPSNRDPSTKLPCTRRVPAAVIFEYSTLSLGELDDL